jgi:hypothetical protein
MFRKIGTLLAVFSVALGQVFSGSALAGFNLVQNGSFETAPGGYGQIGD